MKTLFTPTRFILVLLGLITLASSMDPLLGWFRYDADLANSGQWWRAVTAWVAQLNLQHWLLNQWGLIVMGLLLPERLSKSQLSGFVAIWLVSSVLLLRSDYSDYVGLSGLLYGWLIYAAVLSPFYSVSIRCVFIAVLSAKVLWENFMPTTDQSDWVGRFINAQVAHESHFWGWVSGVIVIAIWLVLQQVSLRRAHHD